MWWGIKKNCVFISVKFFTYRPTIFDFDIYHSKDANYEIVEVNIVEKE